MLGLPTNNSFIETRTISDFRVQSHGFFVQDDWRVSDRLTVNLGLRYDLEQGMTEADNRNTRGFDLTTASPIQAAAQAAFAANQPAGVPLTAAQFASRLVGGYTFAASGDPHTANPHAWDADRNNFQPRFGATYKLSDKSVLRGGFGSYTQPFQIQGVPNVFSAINQINFSRNTPVPVTNDSGLTFWRQPVEPGAQRHAAGSDRWGAGVEHEPGRQRGIDLRADHSHQSQERGVLALQLRLRARTAGADRGGNLVPGAEGTNLPLAEPLELRAAGIPYAEPVRDTAAETFLTQTVSNPFAGLFPDNPGVNGATIARRRLLLQYPQFDSFTWRRTGDRIATTGWCCGRTSASQGGVMVMTHLHLLEDAEQVAPLNPWEGLEDRVGAFDRPHRFTFATVLELPFGTGPPVWPRLARRDRSRPRRVAVRDQVTNGRWGSRWCGTATPISIPGCGDPKSLQSAWGTNSSGQKLGIDVPFSTRPASTR